MVKAPVQESFVVPATPFGPDVPMMRMTTPVARRFYQICLAMVAQSLADAQLTPPQFGTLAYLNRQTGEPGIDQAGLAVRLGIDRNNTGLAVAELEAKELVERRIDPADKRARCLYLTPKGERLYRQLLPANNAANERILAPLMPRERELLLDLLIRIIQANAIYARPGAARRKRGARLSAVHKG